MTLPALAIAAGILLSDAIGPQSASCYLGCTALAIGATIMVLRLACAGQRRASVLLVLALVAVGVARHGRTLHIPADHVSHVLREEPLLARVVATVVTPPVLQRAGRGNPFSPLPAVDRQRLLVALRAFHTSGAQRSATGIVRVTVMHGALDLRVGDELELTGWLRAPAGPRNPGAPDWARIAARQGIDADMFLKGPQYVRRKARGRSTFAAIRTKLRGYARYVLLADAPLTLHPESTNLLDTMVLGKRSATERSLNEAFVRAGGAHFLAVSGFHVGVIAFSAFWIASIIGLRRRPAVVAMVVIVGVYMLVAESKPPILRAGIVIAVVALAMLAQRPVNALNALALAATVILLATPNALFQAGFQLSFLQAAALVTLIRGFQARLQLKPPDTASLGLVLFRRTVTLAVGLLIVCTWAWLISLPLVLYHFQRVSLWGILGTWVMSPIVVVVIWLSFLKLLLGTLLPIVAGLLTAPIGVCTDWLLAVAHIVETLPGASVQTPTPTLEAVVASYIALFGGTWWVRTRRLSRPSDVVGRPDRVSFVLRHAALVTLLSVAWLGWYAFPRTSRAAELWILDVGNGSAHLLVEPGGEALVVDAGTMGAYDVAPVVQRALRALRARPTDVLVTHANFDHYSGVPTLATAEDLRLHVNPYFDAEVADGTLAKLAAGLPERTRAARRVLAAGDTFRHGAAAVEVLWPPAAPGPWPVNDRSLVIRVRCHGRRLLLTGDIEQAAQRALVRAAEVGEIDLDADVLIAPHHGAVLPQVTAAFFAAVSPEVVVASTRRAQPGLKPLVDTLFGQDCRTYLTREVGAVGIRVAPDGRIEVRTPFGPR